MLRTLLLFPLLVLLATATLSAQNSSKSKSKDRFREKDDTRSTATILNVSTVNSPQREMAPAFYQNGIVFLSNKEQRGSQQTNGEPPFNLYFAPFDPNGNPATAQNFSLNLTGAKNAGPVIFSRDFKTAYYSQNNNKDGQTKPGKDGIVRLKIYWAKAGSDNWESQGELPFCSDDYSCMTPSLSIDGKRMYFASDQPGGYGGYDIYYADLNASGSWGTPVNVGPEINTPQNDISPCITQAGTLFFASAGHNTLGGRDLFYSNWVDNTGFGDVVNLNSPFNTEADESSILIDFEGKRGFFTSERGTGYGKSDIYAFTIANGIKGTEKPQIIPAEILVVNARTGAPLKGANIYLLQPAAEGIRRDKGKSPTFNLVPVQNSEQVFRLQIVDKKGEDLGPPDLFSNAVGQASADFTRYRTYSVVVSLEGFQTAKRLVQADTDDSGRLKFSLQEEAKSEAVTVLNQSLQSGTILLLEKTFAERNKATLNDEAVRQMDVLYDLMQQYPAMDIDLDVHNDTRGDAKMNLELTEARAKNAKTYLVYRGIDEKRINANGKGESEPRNQCAEGVSCSDEQHAENNRIEIKIRKL